MHIAIAIITLFAGGGLQHDCATIARLLKSKGHRVTIFTSERRDDFASDLEVIVLPNNAFTNHGRNRLFAVDLERALAQPFDCRVSFNALVPVDLLYCADRSVLHRIRERPLLNWIPRYRTLARLEATAFAPGRPTRILLLSDRQKQDFQAAWHTEEERIDVLPPQVARTRCHPSYRTDGTRPRMRTGLGFASDGECVWLAIGVQPLVKGLDRTIRALAEFHQARLVVAGLSEAMPAARPFVRLARRIGVASRIRWLGYCDDIAELMSAADLLVHPARYDTTGTVILEAVVNGLPVVATAACGYAIHVHDAAAGLVVEDPFEQAAFLRALAAAGDPTRAAAWSTAGVQYGRQPQLYAGHAHAVDAILGLEGACRGDRHAG